MLISLALTLLTLLPGASANERRFANTYESETLPKNAVEIEPWTTVSPGQYGLEFAHRLEFEVGLTNRLQTAFYLNFAHKEDAGFQYEGVSSEWKYKLLSRGAKPVGLALYGELGLAPMATELEAKVLLDKEFGRVLVAYNLVGEMELEREIVAPERDTSDQQNLAVFEVETEVEKKIENKLGIAVRFAEKRAGAGLEVVHELELGEELENVVLVGPALSYGTTAWWGAMSFLPVVVGGAEGEFGWESRLLLGFSL